MRQGLLQKIGVAYIQLAAGLLHPPPDRLSQTKGLPQPAILLPRRPEPAAPPFPGHNQPQGFRIPPPLILRPQTAGAVPAHPGSSPRPRGDRPDDGSPNSRQPQFPPPSRG